ncbi:cyclic diguanylate phosphodiesterase [Chitiniphilus shinanonensis]|uniref:Cyclic diguanylate phosphodiesterase n=1 Tax=Chitiniphilus shinanonensis TaxID=553088 RepID=A0ABQ6BRR2_9NEIS|nr:EAL domain-containing protein [Chitiniphilus shinanonensis]GLS04174.1 cyclic diguanylate phosphodiesterase [Chitiniphilus shinanonensis]
MEELFFLGRQPIINRQRQLVAYELLFRDGGLDHAQVTDDLAASAAVINHTFTDLGLAGALEGRSAFINVNDELLFSDLIELLPADRVVLELLETIALNDELYHRCAELHALGYRLALDDLVALEPGHLPLLSLIDVIKVDVMLVPFDELAPLVAKLRHVAEQMRQRPIQLLAEKVASPEMQRHCSDLGFDLFQGYYFARPTILSGRRLNPAQTQLLSLLGLLQDDADIEELELAFKRAPNLALGLLKLVNSVACGLPVRISSVRHAITLLGLRQLFRWLQILMFAQGGNPEGGDALLHTVVCRARFMERLAQTLVPRDQKLADKAFLAGLLSLLDALFGRPLVELLPELNLNVEVQTALLGSPHASRMGAWLALTVAAENGDVLAVRQWMATEPMLELPTINRIQVEAMQWSTDVGRQAVG